MKNLFSKKWYKKLINNKQEVMIGYPDSSKDAGKICASWSQYKAQEQIVKLAKKKPEVCLSAECQNTLKDRVRLTQGKLQHINIQRYLFTASGLNAATKSDHQDLTQNKIKELEEYGVKLVVFKKVKEDKFADEETVFSYEQFFNEIYPNALKNWKKK